MSDPDTDESDGLNIIIDPSLQLRIPLSRPIPLSLPAPERQTPTSESPTHRPRRLSSSSTEDYQPIRRLADHSQMFPFGMTSPTTNSSVDSMDANVINCEDCNVINNEDGNFIIEEHVNGNENGNGNVIINDGSAII